MDSHTNTTSDSETQKVAQDIKKPTSLIKAGLGFLVFLLIGGFIIYIEGITDSVKIGIISGLIEGLLMGPAIYYINLTNKRYKWVIGGGVSTWIIIAILIIFPLVPFITSLFYKSSDLNWKTILVLTGIAFFVGFALSAAVYSMLRAVGIIPKTDS